MIDDTLKLLVDNRIQFFSVTGSLMLFLFILRLVKRKKLKEEYSLLWLGLLLSTQHLLIDSTEAIMGASIGYLFLFSIAKIYFLLRKQDGMGLGDCKMLAMIGAWVGTMSLLNVLLFSTFLALMISVVLLLFKKLHKGSPISFGPYLAIAGWCTALYGSQLMQWISQWIH